MYNLLLMASNPNDPNSGMFSMILIMAVVFVFMILPQIRKNKEMKKFRATVERGDKVVLTAGIHGKIIEEDENTYLLETEGQGRLRIDKAAVSMESTRAVYPKDKVQK